MKESISTSFLFSAVIVIIGLCTVIIIGGLNFSKAFKIKNRVVEIIERHKGFDASTQTEVEAFLKESGYPVNDTGFECPRGRGESNSELRDSETGVIPINDYSNFSYCVYQYKTVRGYYYSVVSYMQIELPIAGRIRIPIYGDTKVFLEL